VFPLLNSRHGGEHTGKPVTPHVLVHCGGTTADMGQHMSLLSDYNVWMGN